jgi:hypothetical protein
MDTQREQPPFPAISGTSVRLGERDTIAIYRLDDLAWVARFRDGQGELHDAAAWFRDNARLLRSSRVGPVSAIETVNVLTPELVARIAQLHQRVNERRARQPAALAAPAVAIRRACARMVTKLQGWRVQLLRRAG